MTRVRQRLAKIEAMMTDRFGFVPLSPAWISHWTRTTDEILTGEIQNPTERIPISFVDWLVGEAHGQ